MKKYVVLASALIAGLAGAGFVENGMIWPFFGCLGYMVFVLLANTKIKKKPRAATRGREKAETNFLNFYSTTTTIRTQAKTWTPAGKMIIPVHYEE